MFQFRVVVMLLVAHTSWANEPDDACAAPHGTEFEAKLHLADSLTPAQFAAELKKLAPHLKAILATDEHECAALVRLEASQLAVVQQVATVEPWEPLVGTAFASMKVRGRPRLEPRLQLPGWELRALPNQRVRYLVKLVSPFNAAHVEFIETMAYRLKVAPVDLEFFEYEPNSPSVVLRGFLTPAEAARVAKMPEVRWVGVLEPVMKVSFAFGGRTCPFADPNEFAAITKVLAQAGHEPTPLMVGVFELTPKIRALLDGRPMTIDESMLYLTAPVDLVRQLATQPEVEWVEPSATATVD